jgi:hypothetical protein
MNPTHATGISFEEMGSGLSAASEVASHVDAADHTDFTEINCVGRRKRLPGEEKSTP